MTSLPTLAFLNVWAVVIGIAACIAARYRANASYLAASVASTVFLSDLPKLGVKRHDHYQCNDYGISEAFVIQFFRFMMAALREAIYYEADDRTTQMPRALQDRLADIDLLTGWKMVLAVVTLKWVLLTWKVWAPVLTSEVGVVAEGILLLSKPTTDLFRQLGWNARLLATLSTAVLVVDSDFLVARSSSWFLFEVLAGKSGPHHLLLELFPWGSYGWYGGCAFLGMFTRSMGAMSIFVGLLVLTQSRLHNKCSLGTSLLGALNFWSACFCLHAVIWVWRELHPSSLSSAANAWPLTRDSWWWRLPVEMICLGVTNWLADREQAKSTKASGAAYDTQAINMTASSNECAPDRPTDVPASSTLSNNAAQLANHAGAIAAVLARLGPGQHAAAIDDHQQASTSQVDNSQATEDELCELAQRLVDALQQLLLQQCPSSFVPSTTAMETLNASLAAGDPLQPVQDLGTPPEVATAAAPDLSEVASLTDSEEHQDGLSTIPESTSKPISASNPPESEPPASGPPEYESFSGCASDRRGTDDQRSNAWSAKEKVPKSAARLKKAVEKLQPSEETRRKFCERRHQKKRHVVQGLRQICRTMTPCFQNQAVQH